MDSKRSGFERIESGINARAIDFAKFGRLYLYNGSWNARQVIPAAWVAKSTQEDRSLDRAIYYLYDQNLDNFQFFKDKEYYRIFLVGKPP